MSKDILAQLEILQRTTEQFLELHLDLPNDLKVADAVVLMRMAKGDSPRSATDVRRDCYFGSNPSYTLTKLEKAGYIKRCRLDSDKRIVRCMLTPVGEKVAETTARCMEYLEARLQEAVQIQGTLGTLFREVHNSLGVIGLDFSPSEAA